MTEVTDNIDIGRGILFYDNACGFCRGSMQRWGGKLRRRGFRLLPLQSPVAIEMTGLPIEDLLEEAHLLTPERRVLRGIDTLLYIAAASPMMRPLTWLGRLPGTMTVLRCGYRFFARNRYGISVACGLDNHPGGHSREGEAPAEPRIPDKPRLGWSLALPVALFAASLTIGEYLPTWAWMWTIACAIYFACKWITWWPMRAKASRARGVGYLFANPGMNAEAFLTGAAPDRPTAKEWGDAIAKTFAGAAFVWIVPRLLIERSPMLAGWAAMIGIALTLHFGLLHAIVLAWRSAGVAADPLMNRPTRATSLADFWGRRWNMGFHVLARELVFTPLVRRGFSATVATSVIFAISGIVHDIVISIPARGGYGLPTLYFLIQLAGLMLERTAPLRALVRRHRFLGRVYAYAFTLLPAPLLFHGPFVHNVILPFVKTIGGLS